MEQEREGEGVQQLQRAAMLLLWMRVSHRWCELGSRSLIDVDRLECIRGRCEVETHIDRSNDRVAVLSGAERTIQPSHPLSLSPLASILSHTASPRTGWVDTENKERSVLHA